MNQLNASLWKGLKKDRRLRFVFFGRGWDAYMRGETIFAPPWWTDEERAEYHRGYKAAQALAWDFRGSE